MATESLKIKIPPTQALRERLAEVVREGRLLRQALRLARARDKENDQARNRTSFSSEFSSIHIDEGLV